MLRRNALHLKTFTASRRLFASVETSRLSETETQFLLRGNPYSLAKTGRGQVFVTGVDPFAADTSSAAGDTSVRRSNLHDPQQAAFAVPKLLGSRPTQYVHSGWDHVTLGWPLEQAIGKPMTIGATLTRDGKDVQFTSAFDPFPQGSRVKSVACGYRSSYYVVKPFFADNDSMELWLAGSKSNGKMGLPAGADTAPLTKAQIQSPVQVAAGYDHALVLTSQGHVYVTGNGADGQLGLDKSYVDEFTRIELHPFINLVNGGVVSVRAGADMSGLVTRDGSVFVWGNCEYGQLGQENVTRVSRPTELPLARPLSGRSVADMQFGDSFIAFLDGKLLILTPDHGSVYTMGKGALGVPRDQASRPVLVDFFEGKGISQIFAGPGYAAALAKDSSVYVWGLNSKSNRLGVAPFDEGHLFVETPQKIALPRGQSVKQVALWHDGMLLSVHS